MNIHRVFETSLYSGERSSRCVWAIWFMMLSTVWVFRVFCLFFNKKIGLLEMGLLWRYFLESLSIAFAGISNRFALWKMRMPRGMWSCGSSSPLTDQFDHELNFFTFLFLGGVGPYYRALAPAGRTSPIASLLGAAGKLGKAIAQDILKAANRGNIIKLRMNFFLSCI